MSSAPAPVRNWRENITVEISVKPLPATSRFRAIMDLMIARIRHRVSHHA